ncbi:MULTISPECIES: LuxR family transcriptional regulator [unclassified Pseudomonas]|uniref:LuxR family transcriptional regulator n=1 Tax=unclassified Pseudomonas TaxID=196821 RepID=UPI0011A8E832|nr:MULTISPECIES: LuxR family transcriptional regulator [unclassified Pseudomonas]
MLDCTAEDWPHACDFPTLLEKLPRLIHTLGFHYFHFAYVSDRRNVTEGNLLPGGAQLVQAALGTRPEHARYSNLPLLWDTQTFRRSPDRWREAHALGLRHGWIQPVRLGLASSYLAVLRPHVSVSRDELYLKSAWIMWLSERLHLAVEYSDGAPDSGNHCLDRQ